MLKELLSGTGPVQKSGLSSLSAVLDAVPRSRFEFVNLALIEQTLLAFPAATLASVPPVALLRAAEELRQLPGFNFDSELQLFELQMQSQILRNDGLCVDGPRVEEISFFASQANEDWPDTRPMQRG